MTDIEREQIKGFVIDAIHDFARGGGVFDPANAAVDCIVAYVASRTPNDRLLRAVMWAFDRLDADFRMTKNEQSETALELRKVLAGQESVCDTYAPNEWDASAQVVAFGSWPPKSRSHSASPT